MNEETLQIRAARILSALLQWIQCMNGEGRRGGGGGGGQCQTEIDAV